MRKAFIYSAMVFSILLFVPEADARIYQASTGRFMTRDPIGIEGDANVYRYVRNSPVSKVDSYGLWGEDVHSGIDNIGNGPEYKYGTYLWAIETGYTDEQAKIIAKADNDVDSYWSWMAKQEEHFDRDKSPEIDTRLELAEKHMQEAIDLLKDGRCKEAYKEVGRGLHSLQDFYAHGAYGLDQWPTITKPHLGYYDDWDDPRKSQDAYWTEKSTKLYLQRFMFYLNSY